MKIFLLCLLCVLSTFTLLAQTISMPINGSNSITTSNCNLSDDGGVSRNYSENCNATYVIQTSNSNTFFSIVGSYDLEEYNKSRLVIYEGGSTSTITLGSFYGGIGTINICSNSSTITVRFFSDTDTPRSGFILNIVENTCPRATDIEVSNITSTTAHLEWDGGNGSTSWIVECYSNNMPNGINTYTTTNNYFDITGLNPLVPYRFRVRSNCTPVTTCSFVSVNFITLCPCPKATNAYATIGDRTLTVRWTEPDTNIIWIISMTYNGQTIIDTTYNPNYVFDSLPIEFEYYTIIIYSDCYPYNLNCNHTILSYQPPPPPPPPPFECQCPVAHNPIVTDIQLTSVDINWDPASNNNMWILQYKGENSSIWLFDTVNTNYATLNNLEPITKYECYIHSYCDSLDYRCKVYCQFFTYSDGCFNFLDLNGSNCYASYGSFDSPFEHTGVINYGPYSSMSRHTIMKDTIERDPRTNNMLSYVPPGEKASVRLGNWNYGAESESIDYLLYVDTNNFDLLLLNYAIVLQDPDHDAGRQPHFLLSIWNEQGRVVDETCGFVNFYSGDAVGWNKVDSINVIWKDWTTMGLDLSPYHGTRISIKLTTFDCQEGGHYGYAYYTLSCSNKSATRRTCGNVDSISLEAPKGFIYSWYFDDTPEIIFSREREVKVFVDNSIIYCKCTSTENPLCYFNIKYIAERNYPFSLFDYQVDSCSREVTFFNRSIVSNNDTIPRGDKHCYDVKWIFQNGTESIMDTTYFTFDTLGVFPVMLISSLNNGDCIDTLIKNVIINPYFRDTIRAYICEGKTYDNNGFLENTEGVYSVNFITERGCDSLIFLDLKVYQKYNQTIFDSVCKGYNYSDYGFYCNNSGVYTHNLQSMYGCDSIVTLNLTQIQAFPDYSIIENKYILVEDFPITIDVTNSSSYSYYWNTGSTNPILEIYQPGSYHVILYTHCGNILDSVFVAVPEVNVFVPNAFTPFLDKNNTFFPIFESKDKLFIETFEIYNRWGERIYSSNKLPWDGRYKGRLVENGAYIWRLIYRTKYTAEKIFEKTGEVNIVR